MKIQHVALITVAIGLCFAVIPQLIPAKQPTQTWNPPKVEKPITTTNGVNPYQDAIDNQYQMTDESLGTIDETYGQSQPQIKLPGTSN